MTVDRDAELVRLRAENARLIGLLEVHGIAWRLPEPGSAKPWFSSRSIGSKWMCRHRNGYESGYEMKPGKPVSGTGAASAAGIIIGHSEQAPLAGLVPGSPSAQRLGE